jgi:hypothetical protein
VFPKETPWVWKNWTRKLVGFFRMICMTSYAEQDSVDVKLHKCAGNSGGFVEVQDISY